MESSRYRIFSDYMKNKYGEKVYKLPVNLPVTCPNRDGTCGTGGCFYCGGSGAGYENLSPKMSVRQQLQRNMDYIRTKYKAQKFIAYFQNFSNTYQPPEEFRQAITDACMPDIVEIYISTRPDCIAKPYLDILHGIRQTYGRGICIELGVQTVQYRTLRRINRGHTLAEVVDAMRQIGAYGFETCAHMILNLPGDTIEDVIEGAKLISALGFSQVKLHALYIVKGTVFEKQYNEGNLSLCSSDEYVERAIAFLEYLDPNIVVQRLIGRAPEECTAFANWNISWWRIKDEIEREMERRDTRQGARFDYLGGSAVRRFLKEDQNIDK